MTTPSNEEFSSSSNSACSNILSLSVGQLCSEERAKLVNSILSNPETAALAKLGLRVASPAHQTASGIVFAASLRRAGAWNARNLVTGACASLALLAIFSFSNLSMHTIEPSRVAMSQVQSSDRFGPTGSFEGAATLSSLESLDRFGSGGFEAD